MALLKSVVCGYAVCLVAVFLIRSAEAVAKIHRAGPRPQLKNAANTDEFSSDLFPDYNPWFYALFGTLLVGLTGIFPLLVIPVEAGHKLREGGNNEQ
jgi:zinc transporter 13